MPIIAAGLMGGWIVSLVIGIFVTTGTIGVVAVAKHAKPQKQVEHVLKVQQPMYKP